MKFLPVIVSTPSRTATCAIRGGRSTLKRELLVAVPRPVVTEIRPVVAPDGTFALIDVLPVTVRVRATLPLNLTIALPPKFVPVIVTHVPTGPLAGEKPVTVGATAVTVKLELLVAVPPLVVTEIAPVVAPDGTLAVIDVLSVTVRVYATVPLNLTTAPRPKPVPVIVTDDPTGPLAGEKPVTAGATTATLEPLAPVPAALATDTQLAANTMLMTSTGALRRRRNPAGRAIVASLIRRRRVPAHGCRMSTAMTAPSAEEQHPPLHIHATRVAQVSGSATPTAGQFHSQGLKTQSGNIPARWRR